MIINFNKILKAFETPLHEPFTHYVIDDVLSTLDLDNWDTFHQMLGELDAHKDSVTDLYKPYRMYNDKSTGKEFDKPLVNTWGRIRLLKSSPYAYQEPHMDEITKVWTCIVYCSPEEGDGTVLYKGGIDNLHSEKKIEWKQNRALIFSPGGNKSPTWHRVINSFNFFRKVVAINIVTNPSKTKYDKFRTWEENKLS